MRGEANVELLSLSKHRTTGTPLTELDAPLTGLDALLTGSDAPLTGLDALLAELDALLAELDALFLVVTGDGPSDGGKLSQESSK
jgi:hypothetical protein